MRLRLFPRVLGGIRNGTATFVPARRNSLARFRWCNPSFFAARPTDARAYASSPIMRRTLRIAPMKLASLPNCARSTRGSGIMPGGSSASRS